MASLISWFKKRKDDAQELASRVYDQVNPLDNGRTFENRQGNVQQPRSAAQQLFHSGAANVVGGAVKPVVQGVNTAATLIPLTAQLMGLGRESVFGTDQSYKKLEQDYAKSRQELFNPRGGAFYQGTAFKDANDAANISPQDLAKNIGGSGLEIASVVAPAARGTAVLRAGMGAKQAIPRLAAEGAVYSGLGSTGAQLADTGTVNPKQLATDVAIGTALGPATYGIGRGAQAARGRTAAPAIEAATPDAPSLQTVNTANRAIPENVNPATGEIIENPTLAQEKITNDIVSDLGTPGITTTDIIDRHIQRTGVSPEQANKDVWNTAQNAGFDIQNRVPVRREVDPTPMQKIQEGVNTRQADLDAIKEATDILKTRKAQGMTGVKHAVKIKESAHQQISMFVGKDGKLQTIVSQKTPEGAWREIRESAAPIKSATDNKATLEVLDDNGLQKAVAQASNDGLTRQYIWAEDPKGFSAGLLTDGKVDPVTPRTKSFDPNKHTIQNGFVRDKDTGEILGNYVAVGPNGIQVQVGRQFITLDIDPSKIQESKRGFNKGGNNSFNQTERWVEAITDDPATRQKLREIVIYPTRQAEARLKVESNALGKGIQSWRKALNETVPAYKRKSMQRDAVYALEPPRDLIRASGSESAKKQMYDAFENNYGERATNALHAYDIWMRSAYDNLLERVNAVRRANGQDEIPRRNDYITHIQEINGSKIGQLYQNASESIFGEVEGSNVRGKLPSQISGRTETFAPINKYSPYYKKREGDLKPSDPFSPLMAYSKIALHNIHLTKPAALTRSLEQALRAAQEYSDEVGKLAKPNEPAATLAAKMGGDYSDSIAWLGEHSNILSGKSSSANRKLLDSEGGRRFLKGITSLQKMSGRANILGNMSSVLSQGLSLPNAVGTNGGLATTKGIARSFGDARENAAWRQSDFLKERYTDGTLLNNKTIVDKVLKPLGVPLQAVERAMSQIIWNGAYERALSRKLSGNVAIRAADSTTSKIIAGRSIGDTAHVYNSALGSAGLQFTREATESWKNFVSDQSLYGKALTLAAIFVANQGFKEVTGRSPLADPVAAVKDTISDFQDNDSELTGKEKAIRAGQRTAETVVKGVPLLSAVANNVIPQDQRKGLFGTDSEFGRYDSGISAASGPISAGKGIADLAQGNIKSGVQNLLGTVPAGAQIRKTWQGADVINKGYTENAQGNLQTPTNNLSNVDKAKALIFGRNAIGDQQEYYNQDKKPLSDSQTARYKELKATDAGAAQAYLDQINNARNEQMGGGLNKKQEAELSKTTDKNVAAGIKQLLNNEDYKDLSSEDQKKALDRLTGDLTAVEKQKYYAKNQLGQYASDYDGKEKKLTKNQRKIAEGNIDVNKYLKPSKSSGGQSIELASGLTNKSRDILEKYDDMEESDRKKWFNTDKTAEYEYEAAKYENDRINGTLTAAQELRTRTSLNKARIGAGYSKDIRDVYTLSKANIENYLQSVGNDQSVIDELKSYDQALKNAGVNKYLKFKNGISSDGKVASGGKAKKAKKPKIAKISLPKLKKIKTPSYRVKTASAKIPKFRSSKVKTTKFKRSVNT